MECISFDNLVSGGVVSIEGLYVGDALAGGGSAVFSANGPVIQTARDILIIGSGDGLSNNNSLIWIADAADVTLSGVTEDLEIEDTITEFDDAAEKPTAKATMTWRALYRVDATDPTTIVT